MVEADLQIRPSVEQWNSQAEKLAALQDVSQMHESRVLALEETARTGGSGSRGECSSVVVSCSSSQLVRVEVRVVHGWQVSFVH